MKCNILVKSVQKWMRSLRRDITAAQEQKGEEEDERRNSEGEKMQSERVTSQKAESGAAAAGMLCLGASAAVWSGASPPRPLARVLASLTGTLARSARTGYRACPLFQNSLAVIVLYEQLLLWPRAAG